MPDQAAFLLLAGYMFGVTSYKRSMEDIGRRHFLTAQMRIIAQLFMVAPLLRNEHGLKSPVQFTP
jgi:hypothetical protein